MNLTIWTGGVAKSVAASDGDTVLEAALAAGVRFPFGCQSGECGVCKCELVEGVDFDLRSHTPTALSERERARGKILACCAVIKGSITVRLAHQDVVDQHVLPCRVTAVEQVTGDVAVFKLLPEYGRSLSFKAGQFVQLRLPNGAERAYSMANRPDETLLEFHVRRWAGGAASEYIHRTLAVGDSVQVKGPKGDAWYRDEHPGPILAIAGGTGIAPITSIVRTAVARDPRRPIHLYFGVRRPEDFYGVEVFEAMAGRHPNVRFVPVAEFAAGGRYRKGLVTDAVAEDFGGFESGRIYMAGPPAMIAAGRDLAARFGVDDHYCHADSFVNTSGMAA
ncbi:FAD-binding oxidoreductase [Telmatospirillum sp.]|uniref:FAD-binding oxidoreductase n=1 Tax=Telmatospirillum sp. TaxID=2079197 RepID=UPI002847DF00|nr:FAD-binding oxidoreductase [Telmatospirillum sp.]MDR3440150.1 FAD-binding oxidoreductase [Telmatospirillum sp.]